MKKALIGGLIGGLILFIWQFLSWSMLNIHGSQMSHTPYQDQILKTLDDLSVPEGTYFLPNVPPELQLKSMPNFRRIWQEILLRHFTIANQQPIIWA